MVLVLFFVTASHGRAQFEAVESVFGDIIGNDALQPALVMSPSYPGAEEEVEVSVPATIVDVSGGIRWLVNGRALQEFENERSITYTTGALGETILFTALVTGRDGSGQTLTKGVTPTEVDITIEGKTIVPGFYKGRALPSRGAEVLLTAIPQTGSPVPHENFSYRWQVGNNVLSNGIVRGSYQQSVTMPVSRPELVRVDVYGTENNLLVSKTFELSFHDPLFRFYETSPLLGISPLELGMRTLASDTEVAVRAEPYYFDPNMLEEEHQLRWNMSRRTISSDPDDELRATINIRGSGSVRMSASLRSAKQLLQYADGETVLRYSE